MNSYEENDFSNVYSDNEYFNTSARALGILFSSDFCKGVDMMTLIKENGKWLITSDMFARERSQTQ